MNEGDNEPAGRAGADGTAAGEDESLATGAMSADASTGDAASGGAAGDVSPEAQRQLDEQRDKYLRLAAEYDNFRKRMVRERTEAASRGQAELIRHIMDALDDLARFAHVDPDAAEAKTVVQGVEMVERKLLKALQSAGLTIVSPENSSFNPELHEAVATEPAASPEDDHVVSRVFQPGYVFNGQLLRPARVVVKQWNG
ncbi:MAG: nucleotide exchange factor GrpE [Gemmatimonadota bacterium]|nr:nucleotide exchange factor GrpE [Gemmatimonadota bacterium]